MIVAISDTHLGARVSNRKGLEDFVDFHLRSNQNDIDHIFLLGDIFDLWRRPNAEVIVENQRILDKMSSLDIKIHYLSGNHDLAVRSIEGWLGATDDVFAVSAWELLVESLGVVKEVESMEYDGLNLRFCHGYQIDYWTALRFYEAFCEAMCSTVGRRDSPDEEWDAFLLTSVELPAMHRQWIEQAPKEVRTGAMLKLASPLDTETDYTKISGLAEWSVLRNFTDIEWLEDHMDSETSETLYIALSALGAQMKTQQKGTRNSAKGVSALAHLWIMLMDTLAEYSTNGDVPRTTLNTLSRMKRLAGRVTVGLREYEYLIRGHGHRPFADSRLMVADAGCWLGTQGSYLEISDGNVRQSNWTPREKK
jgi:UDP-2,3-diacylglucosamine pyrophosphatase LpxH